MMIHIISIVTCHAHPALVKWVQCTVHLLETPASWHATLFYGKEMFFIMFYWKKNWGFLDGITINLVPYALVVWYFYTLPNQMDTCSAFLGIWLTYRSTITCLNCTIFTNVPSMPMILQCLTCVPSIEAWGIPCL